MDNQQQAINIDGLPPQIADALRKLGYPTQQTPMSKTDGVNIVMPASTDYTFQQVAEPSQQWADNFSRMLYQQETAKAFDQPYIPYLHGW